MRLTLSRILLLSSLLLLSACSTVDKLNPFTDSKPVERSPQPANSTAYECDNNKRFYVRMLDKSDAVWLIYPDREVNLDKVAGAGSRYSNGTAVLEINGAETTLDDGANIAYKNCKATTTLK